MLGSHAVANCHGHFCCRLSYRSRCPNAACDRYRLVVYSGVRPVADGLYSLGVQVCGIVACGRNSARCGRPVTEPWIFDSIRLEANFSDRFVLPTAIDNQLNLLDRHSLDLPVFQLPLVSWKTKRSLSDVLSFALYGRLFDLDPE